MAGGAAPEWATWQLLDSLLPTGAFAHSLGLEAALRHGWLGGGAGAADGFPFGPPALHHTSLTPRAGGQAQGSVAVAPGGGASDSGTAVRVFALSAMANVASQLLPFVVAAHLCMSAAAGEAQGTPQAALAGVEGDSPGVQHELWAFEHVAEGIGATFWAPPPGASGWSADVQEGAGLGQRIPGQMGQGGIVGPSPGPEQARAGGGVGTSRQVRAVQAWVMLDNILHASLTNHVARRASATQGTALLRAALTIAKASAHGRGVQPAAQDPARGVEPASQGPAAHSLLKALRSRVGSPRGGHLVQGGGDVPLGAHGHHATVYGAAAALLGVPALNAARGYLYGALRDVLSAATRLNRIGPLEAAGLQASLAGAGERMLQQSCAGQALVCLKERASSSALDGPSHEAVWRSLVGSAATEQPLVDVVQAGHDSLSMRLFLS